MQKFFDIRQFLAANKANDNILYFSVLAVMKLIFRK